MSLRALAARFWTLTLLLFMDKHNSLLLTEIAILAFWAAVALPIAAWARDFFDLSKFVALALAAFVTLGLAWLFHGSANSKNRGAGK